MLLKNHSNILSFIILDEYKCAKFAGLSVLSRT